MVQNRSGILCLSKHRIPNEKKSYLSIDSKPQSPQPPVAPLLLIVPWRSVADDHTRPRRAPLMPCLGVPPVPHLGALPAGGRRAHWPHTQVSTHIARVASLLPRAPRSTGQARPPTSCRGRLALLVRYDHLPAAASWVPASRASSGWAPAGWEPFGRFLPALIVGLPSLFLFLMSLLLMPPPIIRLAFIAELLFFFSFS